jgi:D-arabinan exo alpha-(1,3)/(1,5)-arabinofuranosidase (non-reducing end)
VCGVLTCPLASLVDPSCFVVCLLCVPLPCLDISRPSQFRSEDFFLSAFYFDAGDYQFENSGLTYRDDIGTMSAYKFFENDPVLFTKEFSLVWRCGEDSACPTKFPPPKPAATTHTFSPNGELLANTLISTYVWVYTWTY